MSHRTIEAAGEETPSPLTALRTKLGQVVGGLAASEVTLSSAGISRVTRTGIVDWPETSLHGCDIGYSEVTNLGTGETIYQVEITQDRYFPVVAYAYTATKGVEVNAHGQESVTQDGHWTAVNRLIGQTVFIDDVLSL